VTESPTTLPPANIPSPVIYGPDFPKFKMFLRNGKQVFESRTNQNLYLTDDDFTSAGTYPLYRLLDATSIGEPRPFVDPMWVENCTYSHNGTVNAVELVEELDFEKSPALTILLNYSPESHRPFYEKYIQSHWTRSSLGFKRAVETHVERGGYIAPSALGDVVRQLLLSFPALIPEVWLPAVGSDKTLEDQEYVAERPQRVGFVLFSEGRKAVIEIDGPDHYSEWDAALGEWIGSEKTYTRNLKIERSLRRQGWAIHRFSRYEACKVNVADFPKLLAELPIPQGFYYMSSTRLAERLQKAVDDVTF
jgi:hypothetical protein